MLFYYIFCNVSDLGKNTLRFLCYERADILDFYVGFHFNMVGFYMFQYYKCCRNYRIRQINLKKEFLPIYVL